MTNLEKTLLEHDLTPVAVTRVEVKKVADPTFRAALDAIVDLVELDHTGGSDEFREALRAKREAAERAAAEAEAAEAAKKAEAEAAAKKAEEDAKAAEAKAAEGK